MYAYVRPARRVRLPVLCACCEGWLCPGMLGNLSRPYTGSVPAPIWVSALSRLPCGQRQRFCGISQDSSIRMWARPENHHHYHVEPPAGELPPCLQEPAYEAGLVAPSLAAFCIPALRCTSYAGMGPGSDSSLYDNLRYRKLLATMVSRFGAGLRQALPPTLSWWSFPSSSCPPASRSRWTPILDGRPLPQPPTSSALLFPTWFESCLMTGTDIIQLAGSYLSSTGWGLPPQMRLSHTTTIPGRNGDLGSPRGL